jgi:hypothetical protein
MGTKHVHGSTITSNGCKVEIDGDVVYSLIPPRINGFNGVVHITGDIGSPNGDLFFGTEPKTKLPSIQVVDEIKL